MFSVVLSRQADDYRLTPSFEPLQLDTGLRVCIWKHETVTITNMFIHAKTYIHGNAQRNLLYKGLDTGDGSA